MILNLIQDAREYIFSKTNIRPKVAVTLGSGLGLFSDRIQNKEVISYSKIPGFKTTKVPGHEGSLILGKVNNVEVACLQGRIHAYEGHSLEEIVHPTRVMKVLGAETILLTNASGGINPSYSQQDLVMIQDHINFTGLNPLRGVNLDELGPRFPDMTYTYDPKVQLVLKEAAQKINHKLKTGIYMGVMGPTYETPAEVKMFRALGADMVGMSTVYEAIAAHHCGLKVGGISCITNMAAGIEKGKLDHNDIKDQANQVMKTFCDLIEESISRL